MYVGVDCGVCSLGCEVWSVVWKVRSGECGECKVLCVCVWSVKCRMQALCTTAGDVLLQSKGNCRVAAHKGRCNTSNTCKHCSKVQP